LKSRNKSFERPPTFFVFFLKWYAKDFASGLIVSGDLPDEE
jgi:hypothetical protein